MTESPESTVLFDADCGLCRSFAALAGRRAGERLRFRSWQEFQRSEAAEVLTAERRQAPADALRVLTGTTLLEGDGAWRHLLEQHPDLSGLSWIAARLGLTDGAARAMASTGTLLRRFCRDCPQAPRR